MSLFLPWGMKRTPTETTQQCVFYTCVNRVSDILQVWNHNKEKTTVPVNQKPLVDVHSKKSASLQSMMGNLLHANLAIQYRLHTTNRFSTNLKFNSNERLKCGYATRSQTPRRASAVLLLYCCCQIRHRAEIQKKWQKMKKVGQGVIDNGKEWSAEQLSIKSEQRGRSQKQVSAVLPCPLPVNPSIPLFLKNENTHTRKQTVFSRSVRQRADPQSKQ